MVNSFLYICNSSRGFTVQCCLDEDINFQRFREFDVKT